VKCEIAHETRMGRRPYNQDRLGFWQTDQALLLVLADGMGGNAHGGLAAELTLRFMTDAFRRAALPRLTDPDLFLFRAIGKAQQMLCAHARNHGLDETPCTTIVACVVQDGCAYWTHVGDSRLYLIRNGEVLAQTRDHTLVQELLESGRICEEEARRHPRRNVLLQCLGAPLPPRVEPASMVRLARGDKVLLCSDGFHGPLETHEIGKGLLAPTLREALLALAGEAETRAGAQCDNLTVLAMAWQEDPVQAPPAQVEEYMTDEQIEREIERIRHAFTSGTL
jgi:PPM family protein phosphatase